MEEYIPSIFQWMSENADTVKGITYGALGTIGTVSLVLFGQSICAYYQSRKENNLEQKIEMKKNE